VDNSVCILCAGCRKTCGYYRTEKVNGRPNPAYTFIGFANDLYRIKPLLMAEMAFLWILSGFVISENMEEWEATEKLINYFPDLISSSLLVQSHLLSGLIYSVIVFLIMPFFFWSIPFFVSKLAWGKLSLEEYILNYSLAFIPIMAAAHLGKSILQSTSDIPYLKVAFADASGMLSAENIIGGQLILQQNPVWMNGCVWILFCLIMLAGILISIKVINLVNQKFGQPSKTNKTFFLIPVCYGLVFLSLLAYWQWIIW
jgi:hypothetical protein